MKLKAARPENVRLLHNPTTRRDAFVAAVPFTENAHGEPSRVFRVGTGIFDIKLSRYRKPPPKADL
jgi:hypothetical protein